MSRFFLLLLTILPFSAVAMTFSYTDREPISGSKISNYKFLLMEGEIKDGDYSDLLKFLRKDMDPFISARQIIIHSPGGNVSEAMQIGEFIRKTYSEISVGPYYGSCTSSCFLILASAAQRNWQLHTVGIHRPYFENDFLKEKSVTESISNQERLMDEVNNFLRIRRVPTPLVEAMISTPSDQILWLGEPNRTFGRFSPAYEQILVTKCGLDLELESEMFGGKKRLVTEVLKARECGQKLTFEEGMNFFVRELGGTPPF